MTRGHLWPLGLFLVAIVLVLVGWCWRWVRQARLPSRPHLCRHWRPRTPDDCAHCRQGVDRPESAPQPVVVQPWREGRSRRGAPRRIATEGYACHTPGCPYAGNSDSQVHALVADGHHGRTERIQDFVCQACGKRASARWGTALFQLKTPPSRIGEVLSALAEGLSVCAAVRVFGHGEATITRWRDRAAQQAARLHHHFVHDLHLSHVQLDEIRTHLRPRARVLWLWLALDPQTKLIPCPGARSTHPADCAHARPHLARGAGRRMHARDHDRRLAPLLLRAHRTLRPLGRHRAAPSLAGRSPASLWPTAQAVSAPPPRAHPLSDGAYPPVFSGPRHVAPPSLRAVRAAWPARGRRLAAC